MFYHNDLSLLSPIHIQIFAIHIQIIAYANALLYFRPRSLPVDYENCNPFLPTKSPLWTTIYTGNCM